jgi:hypothetical protein
VVTSLGRYPLPGELRVADVDSERSELLTPGIQTIDYDVSDDGQQVVMEVADREGKSGLWLARLDKALPPRRIGGYRRSSAALRPGRGHFLPSSGGRRDIRLSSST